MSTQIDSLDITGMKQSDFIQLEEIFKDSLNLGVYWGRKDYFDARNKRISSWLNRINHQLTDCKIKG